MPETKQQVVDALIKDDYEMAHALGMGYDGGAYWRDRYAKASDGDRECPYCHEKHGEGDLEGDLSDVDDASMLIHRSFSGKWIIDTWGTPGAITPESKPIHFCPMCGRRLERCHG